MSEQMFTPAENKCAMVVSSASCEGVETLPYRAMFNNGFRGSRPPRLRANGGESLRPGWLPASAPLIGIPRVDGRRQSSCQLWVVSFRFPVIRYPDTAWYRQGFKPKTKD